MSPIDRVSQRAFAFTVLGVAASATYEDIRKAYRKLAFEKHPDRNPAAADEFARITAAYDYIVENAEELGIRTASPAANSPSRPRSATRPAVQPIETRISAEAMTECEEMLRTEAVEGAQHKAVSIYRVGRKLTYIVPSAMEKGVNQVAVPTGMLVDSRHVVPKIIVFDSAEAKGNRYKMDDDLCREHFPGARSIDVLFRS